MLEGLVPPKKMTPCKLREIVMSLDEQDKTILRDALANRDIWSRKSLATALTARGLTISEKGIARRDNPCGDCVCR
jgi:hypothetical protein